MSECGERVSENCGVIIEYYADAEVNTLAHMNNIMFHHEDILIINITETEFFSCALGTRVVRFFFGYSQKLYQLCPPPQPPP